MRAVRIYEFGGPEVLKLEELPDPQPGPGQAVVGIKVAGVNFGDTGQYKGTYPGAKLPNTTGSEATGVVTAIGEGVTEVAVGDAVATGGDLGTCADTIVVNADRLIPLPAGVDPKQACAVLMQGRTAHYLVQDAHPLQQGERILVHSGAGGVGSLLIQLARRAGAYVFTTVSSDEKAEFARECGADEVINYARENFADAILKATDGEGVSAVFDHIGKDTFEDNIRCLARRGHLVNFGEASGPPPPVDLSQQTLRQRGSLYVSKHFGADYRRTREEQIGRAYDLFRWLREGELRVHIHREYPLTEVQQAYRDIESRKTMGKILLIP